MAIVEKNPRESSDGLRPGTAFGSYDIVRCIGMGGMGAVFEAVHRLMQRRVALKVLHESIPTTADVDPRERFLREGSMLVRVEHPNVVSVYDAGIVDGMPFLAMELLEGATLDRVAGPQGRLLPRRAVELVADAALGLAAAHDVGIVHRDVKPENIFVTRDARGREVAKLVDFGIAKDFRGGGTRNTAIGTPAYMSPEQLFGGHVVDGRCDQYALGVVLYESLTGSRPYDAPSLVELAIRLEQGKAEPPSTRGVPISAALDAAVMRAIAVDPANRFPSMTEFAAALRASVTAALELERSDTDRPTAAPMMAPRENEPTRSALDSSALSTGIVPRQAVSSPLASAASPEPSPARPRALGRVVGLALIVALAVGLGLAFGRSSRTNGVARERATAPATATSSRSSVATAASVPVDVSRGVAPAVDPRTPITPPVETVAPTERNAPRAHARPPRPTPAETTPTPDAPPRPSGLILER